MDGKDLSSIIKRARDIMRKDAGLSTDVDRIPQLSWILFLKTFDDLEKERALLNPNYREAIQEPYRWRDWAAHEEKGLTGDGLIDFVNSKLFPYLRGLIGTDEKDQRTVIAEVFREIYNSMRSGYLLRDIINLVNGIDFTSSDDIHTMAHLYESMLKEMRDAAGSNGEFYTPRPVIRFIVNQIKPRIGEKILDPALGTGGFLTESFEFMRGQQKKAEDREVLQYHTLYGIEKKPMPYLLGMMNLLLHGIEKPNIKRDNSLRTPLFEITEKDRVDVIITNPPFGGEEEKGIMSNFPEAMRTSETAFLFLQYIMRKLKGGGRCGMIVPDGILSDTLGVGPRIKKELIEDFNLHTIVRLPKGVFAPYTGIETNLLFFEKNGQTKEIWYYEQSLPSERQEMKNPRYTKTQPIRYEEFELLQKWWNSRQENGHAWKVQVEKVTGSNYDLDIKNPNRPEAGEHRLPEEILTEIIGKEERILGILNEIQDQMKRGWEGKD
jgi:type I restriction enzyme M protein